MRITMMKRFWKFHNLIVLIPNNLVSELVSQWLRSQLYYIIRIQFKQVWFKIGSNIPIKLLSVGE